MNSNRRVQQSQVAFDESLIKPYLEEKHTIVSHERMPTLIVNDKKDEEFLPWNRLPIRDPSERIARVSLFVVIKNITF